ncbi:hypothetical protein I79_024586 [Cricetulus griseus]|uniref:Uncharacterized protein n=1 Tax=Cricetulus griseus TaxID=10029 RepID=G3IL26_CRIGR|nr:hypothetical protein I79_024586 [Cricetulus griseus]
MAISKLTTVVLCSRGDDAQSSLRSTKAYIQGIHPYCLGHLRCLPQDIAELSGHCLLIRLSPWE